MSENRYKLHWVTAVIETVKALKEAILPLIVVFFAGGREKSGIWIVDNWSWILLTVLITFLLGSGIIKWRRFSYWFEDNELRIESGLFVKKKRYIPFERIQSLDYTEGIFHRPFHLVKVKVETAGNSTAKEAEAELTAITKEAADRIEKEMAAAKQNRQHAVIEGEESTNFDEAYDIQPDRTPAVKIFSLSIQDLFLLATTSGGIGVILSGAAIFLTQFSEIIPYEWLFDELSAFVRFGIVLIAIIIFLGFAAVWLLSVAMTFISHYGFTVYLDGEDLVVTRGLLEKKRMTVPLKRVQSISVHENLLRQPFGYAAVSIRSAGGAGEGSKITLFPLVKKKEIWEPLQYIFPDVHFEEPAEKVPARGKHFNYRIDFLWAFPLMVLVSWYFFPYGLWSLLLIPLSVGIGLWQYHSSAYQVSGDQLTMRFRTIGLQTAYVLRQRIQSMEMKQSYFHKRKHVATVKATAKSGAGVHEIYTKFMDEQEAEQLLSWYEKKIQQ